MEQKPIVAIMYDFDKTLSIENMQEYAFIPKVGMGSEEAEGKMLLTRDEFKKLGKSVKLFNGVKG